MKTAIAIATDIAANTSAVSTSFTRQMLWQMMGADHPMEAHKIESRCLHHMFASADCKEGFSPFLEKRPADFPLKADKDRTPFFPWWEERPYDNDQFRPTL